jgi:hypothetical protein
MKKTTASLLITCIMLMATLPSAFSWGPFTHTKWSLDILNEAGMASNLNVQLILANEDAFLAGLMYPDVSVIYYYSSFKTYKGLHDWNTADRLWKAATTDRQRAFALGWAVHLSMDMVSHNYYVPDKISSTKLINPIIHPLYELATDTNYIDVKTPHAMEIHQEFDAWVKTVTNQDFSNEAELLNQAIGGGNFYSQSYTLPENSWLFKSYRLVSNIIKPLVKEASYHPYMVRTEDEIRNVLNDNYPTLDPSGEQAIKNSDGQAQLWQWVAGIAVIVLLYFGARKLRWL